MTKLDHELLPDELCWAEGRHASDVALTALADAQLDIVPEAVRAHVAACSSCTTHLGHAALLSLHADRQLAAVKAAEARRPLPRTAIVVALVVAMLGLVPSILDASADSEGARSLVRTAPLALHALYTLTEKLFAPGSPFGLVLTYGTAALLVMMTLAVVSRLRAETKEASE